MTATPARAARGAGVPLLVVAGEASGDMHAARLLDELKRVRPDLRPFGMAGEESARAGVELLAESREVAVVGITEALRVLPRAREVFELLVSEVARRRPPVALLVDFPEFNLRLVKRLKRLGVRVAYYVSPQVWAWRRGRVRLIARWVDRMLVLFPFEAEFYGAHGVQVEHVGHPLVDEVPELPQAWDAPHAGDGPRRLVLLPGSRRSEVEKLLPVMLGAARELARQVPLCVTIVRAQTIAPELLAGDVEEAGLQAAGIKVEVVDSDQRFCVVASSHLALCASGTATLEVALLRTPLLVLYRLHRGSYWLGKLMVRLPWFSLVNLVLQEAVVPELLQADANPTRIAAESLRLLTDGRARAAMRQRLGEVRSRLGASGASVRAATAVAQLLAQPPAEDAA
ncbi:MAG TPA: lipid-A-disaccharide synthase [Thermoanaerobaculia bacterium]|nr:lipid-A-disaccharide synthase [Thermoanaerobaculia bacterium]